ncbi:MAG: 1-(5-phosphoribosyl)-5-[(5-phosphoribosylamino)methylideneamino]imidazole-4-carboxamide isomerase [Stellaceae bacterium]
MILYPAIDLKEGRCVRLVRGAMSEATVFNDDPAAQARLFAAAGCRWLHVVDLDGAFAGKPRNRASVEAVLAAVAIPVQLGGGIRDLATLEAWLGKGVRRAILGTAALRNPALVKEGCRLFPGRVAVGIDARAGRVAVEGWAETSDITALELALRFEDAGVAAIIFTDIERDGMMQGANIEQTAALARRLETPVIASGGIFSLEELRVLKAHEGDGVAGAILGRALYDGRVDLEAALAAAG